MLLETTDTYEAAWYLMNGAILKDVKFSKNDDGSLYYVLVISDIPQRFMMYWYQRRPIGNIRYFSDTRRELKRQIHEHQIKAKVSA